MYNKECPVKRIVKSIPVKVTIGIVAGTVITIATLSEIALIGCRKKKQKEEIDRIRQQIALKDASMMSARRMCEKLDENDK